MSKKFELLKDVGLIIAGGWLEVFTELAVDSVAGTVPIVKTVNTGDLVGALVSGAITAYGVSKKSMPAQFVGGGGLAVATPNVVGKLIM